MSVKRNLIIVVIIILVGILSWFFRANNSSIKYNDFIKQKYDGEFIKQSIELQKYIREKFINPVTEQAFSLDNTNGELYIKDLTSEKEEVFGKISKMENYVNNIDDKKLNKEQTLDHNILKDDILNNLKHLRKSIEECETILSDNTKDIDERYLKYQEKLVYPLESINANIKVISE